MSRSQPGCGAGASPPGPPAAAGPLLPAPCSRRVGGAGGGRDTLGRQQSWLWEAHQRDRLYSEGGSGVCYLVPSSGLPSPSVFPSSSVF